jgi:hypothetical protein
VAITQVCLMRSSLPWQSRKGNRSCHAFRPVPMVGPSSDLRYCAGLAAVLDSPERSSQDTLGWEVDAKSTRGNDEEVILDCLQTSPSKSLPSLPSHTPHRTGASVSLSSCHCMLDKLGPHLAQVSHQFQQECPDRSTARSCILA